MEDLAHPWRAYARIQATLARRPRVDDHGWGLEAGLDKMLVNAADQPTEEEVDRAVRSENRRERHRARLRRVHFAHDHGMIDPADVLAARQDLQAVKAQIQGNDWALLCEIGAGRAYSEMAADRDVTEGQLRVRVLRLRRGLTERLDRQSPGRAAA